MLVGSHAKRASRRSGAHSSRARPGRYDTLPAEQSYSKEV